MRKQKYRTEKLSNDYTNAKLLTRLRKLLYQSSDKWGEQKKERARLLFNLQPDLHSGRILPDMQSTQHLYGKDIPIEVAEKILHEWNKDVNTCSFREIKVARNCIGPREKDVLNYFRSKFTNASAESLNSKIKGI